MSRFEGVIAPILTPFEKDGSIARDLWVSHAQWLLDEGAHYLSPFGTTGEALSVALHERIEALGWLIEAGIPADRLMPGVGVTALPETAALTAHAMEMGCPGVMALPSFFFTAATEDGHARYFAELIDKVASPTLKIILYHIPQNSGAPVTPSLTARLNQTHPDVVVAYKDSGGDWSNTAAVIAAAPSVAVFPGSEAFLTKGLAAGGAGCISATVNLNARAIRAVFDGAKAGGGAVVAAQDEAMIAFRKTVQAAGLIGAMKAALAVRSGDRRWLTLRAPLDNATIEAGEALIAALGEGGAHLRPGAAS